jgi:hypothetical protein
MEAARADDRGQKAEDRGQKTKAEMLEWAGKTQVNHGWTPMDTDAGARVGDPQQRPNLKRLFSLRLRTFASLR